ncbi:MAG: signal recognition particle-docking protein FtsY [Gammaproteobacteria bacterium]|nr:signal recognition particle-docking protein FtsY [Gammaproteobacteria bacterium]
MTAPPFTVAGAAAGSDDSSAAASDNSGNSGGGGLFARLAKTRRSWAGLAGLFSGAPSIDRADRAALEALHDHLLLADVGVAASERIINRLRRDATGRPAELRAALRTALIGILEPCARPLVAEAVGRPFVILMVGVNGVGKTTTAAKLAARLQRDGRKVMLAACDTFRAAAVEQLQHWGRQLDIPVVAQAGGERRADPAAVAFDACVAARARGVDALLIDTAGRQHTDANLMAQLQKITRALGKAEAAFPDEILLTVDAGNGHNALSQVAHFQRATGVTGLCVAKLDGSAKGGMVVALAEQFGAPIRCVGVGQAAADLRPFNAAEFVDALLPAAG